MVFANISLLAVLLSTIFAMVVGGLWYGPLFGKPWARMMGISTKDMKNMPLTAPQAMGLGFITTLLISAALAALLNWFAVPNFVGAIKVALFVWFGFFIPLLMDTFLWQGKEFNVVLLNAAYRLVSLVGMVLIIFYVG